MISSKIFAFLFLFIAFTFVSQCNALFGAPLYKSLSKFEDVARQPYPDANLDTFWTLRPPSAHEQLFYTSADKRNFYTHFWRSIAQRMPSYRGGNSRISSLAEQPTKVDVDKRTPWIERMNAIRTG